MNGWVKVYSYTEPRENILRYRPWYLGSGDDWQAYSLAEGRRHGKGVIARLSGCDDRDQAAALMNREIGVTREQLPETAPGEYYWQDLIGLQVVNLDGDRLGRVDSLIETGAHDVLVISGERERLIPFVMERIVADVDLQRGVIRVDWDRDF